MSKSDEEVIIACSDSDNDDPVRRKDRRQRIMQIEQQCRTGWAPFIATSIIKSVVNINPWSRKRKREPESKPVTSYFAATKQIGHKTSPAKKRRAQKPSIVQETLSSSLEASNNALQKPAKSLGVRKINFEQRTQTQSSNEKYTFNYELKPPSSTTKVSSQSLAEAWPAIVPDVPTSSKSDPLPSTIVPPSSNLSKVTPLVSQRDTQSDLSSAKRDLRAALEASPLFPSQGEVTLDPAEQSHVIVPETSILEVTQDGAEVSLASLDILPDDTTMNFGQPKEPLTPERKTSPKKSLFALSSPITYTPFAADIGDTSASLLDIQQYLKRTNFDVRTEAQKFLDQG